MNSADQQRQVAEFLASAALDLRKVLELDPELSFAQIEGVILKLPQALLEAAPLLARCNDDDWAADIQCRHVWSRRIDTA